LRKNALKAYAKVEPNSPPVGSGSHVLGDSDHGRDLMAFAGYPAIVSFDEASRVWKVPQEGTTHQEYEHSAIHAPGPTPSPDINAEFKSIARTASSSSSPFHSLLATPDPAAVFTPTTDLQSTMSSWIPTGDFVPSFDAYGNRCDDGTLYKGAYIPAENQWNTFFLDAGILPGPPGDNFR